MNTYELIRIIQNNKIVIYGTGYAAKSFYTALKIRGMDRRVVSFAVTSIDKAGKNIYDKPVKVIDDLLKNMSELYICIAVHETIKDEIQRYLDAKGINQYVWVHPFIYDLAFGMPIEQCVEVQIKNIIKTQGIDNYVLSIRYLAIENYYKKNDIGYKIYFKALCLQCNAETARKRLNSYIDLISEWDKNGYHKEFPILIDSQNRLIDGAHRLSLACYHGMSSISCSIYPYSDYYNKILRSNHFLSLSTLEANDFDKYEIDAIINAQKNIGDL